MRSSENERRSEWVGTLMVGSWTYASESEVAWASGWNHFFWEKQFSASMTCRSLHEKLHAPSPPNRISSLVQIHRRLSAAIEESLGTSMLVYFGFNSRASLENVRRHRTSICVVTFESSGKSYDGEKNKFINTQDDQRPTHETKR